MSDERRIALVRDYDGLMAAVRDVVAQRGMSCTTVDDLAGYHSGYSGKLLAQVKSLGPMSMGPMLQVLGLGLVVVELPDEVDRMARRYDRRDEKRVRNGAMRAKASIGLRKSIEADVIRAFAISNAKKGAEAYRRKVPRWKRQRIARKAARARWRNGRG